MKKIHLLFVFFVVWLPQLFAQSYSWASTSFSPNTNESEIITLDDYEISLKGGYKPEGKNSNPSIAGINFFEAACYCNSKNRESAYEETYEVASDHVVSFKNGSLYFVLSNYDVDQLLKTNVLHFKIVNIEKYVQKTLKATGDHDVEEIKKGVLAVIGIMTTIGGEGAQEFTPEEKIQRVYDYACLNENIASKNKKLISNENEQHLAIQICARGDLIQAALKCCQTANKIPFISLCIETFTPEANFESLVEKVMAWHFIVEESLSAISSSLEENKSKTLLKEKTDLEELKKCLESVRSADEPEREAAIKKAKEKIAKMSMSVAVAAVLAPFTVGFSFVPASATTLETASSVIQVAFTQYKVYAINQSIELAERELKNLEEQSLLLQQKNMLAQSLKDALTRVQGSTKALQEEVLGSTKINLLQLDKKAIQTRVEEEISHKIVQELREFQEYADDLAATGTESQKRYSEYAQKLEVDFQEYVDCFNRKLKKQEELKEEERNLNHRQLKFHEEYPDAKNRSWFKRINFPFTKEWWARRESQNKLNDSIHSVHSASEGSQKATKEFADLEACLSIWHHSKAYYLLIESNEIQKKLLEVKNNLQKQEEVEPEIQNPLHQEEVVVERIPEGVKNKVKKALEEIKEYWNNFSTGVERYEKNRSSWWDRQLGFDVAHIHTPWLPYSSFLFTWSYDGSFVSDCEKALNDNNGKYKELFLSMARACYNSRYDTHLTAQAWGISDVRYHANNVCKEYHDIVEAHTKLEKLQLVPELKEACDKIKNIAYKSALFSKMLAEDFCERFKGWPWYVELSPSGCYSDLEKFQIKAD